MNRFLWLRLSGFHGNFSLNAQFIAVMKSSYLPSLSCAEAMSSRVMVLDRFRASIAGHFSGDSAGMMASLSVTRSSPQPTRSVTMGRRPLAIPSLMARPQVSEMEERQMKFPNW